MAPQPTAVSDLSPETDQPALRTTTESLKETTHVLQPLQPPTSWLEPPSPSRLPTLTSTNPDRNNILLVVPTENKDKVRVVRDYFRGQVAPPNVHLPLPDPRKVASDSQVGEQPYDSAGPEGAFNRVVNAVRHLQSDPEHRRVLESHRIGTVIVGSVENFIVRGRSEGEGRAGPVDYGFVVLCRVPVARAGSVESAEPWEWRTGISRGVTVPVDYWREAERAGFEDEENSKEARPRFGKVTVGSLLAEHAGLSSANWHVQLAGVSRYDLLADAMGRMEAPWPESAAKAE